MNPLLKRLARIGEHGRRSERRVIKKKLGGKMTLASGAVPGMKGDGILPEFLIESKSTVNESMSVKLSWLTKITREALEKNRQPALTISFVHGSGNPKPDGDWVLVPLHVFKEMKGES